MRYTFEKDEKKVTIQFRIYQYCDFPMYLNCIKAFYKDGYPYKEYMEQSYLHKKIEEKEILLTVGETEDGIIVSIVAAALQKGSFNRSILFMLRNVLPEYSGGGVASKHLDYLMSLLPMYFPEAESVYADVVTYNANSQQSLIRRGYVFCGIRLMLYKNEIMVPKLSYDAGTKLSQTVYCLNLKKGTRKKIYVPDKHKRMIGSIYQKLGTELEMNSMDTSALKQEGGQANIWQFSILQEHEKAEWMIHAVGDDFEKEIKNSFAQYEKMQNRTAVVYLNMCNPNCKAAWDYFTEKGFYFSGIKPLNQEYEYLMLSDTACCVEQFENIVLGKGEEYLLQYILENK